MADTVKQAAYALAGIYLCEGKVAAGVEPPADVADGIEPPEGEPEPTPPG